MDWQQLGISGFPIPGGKPGKKRAPDRLAAYVGSGPRPRFSR